MEQDRENKEADQDNPEPRELELEQEPADPDEQTGQAAAPVDEPPDGSPATDGALEPADTKAGWFVDFDVWEATLEAKIGSDFEQVLTEKLGQDWVSKLNTQMMSEHNFSKVLDEIKESITELEQGGGGGFVELVSNEDRIGFEALGQGEVIYDESMVGPGGVSGGGGGEQKALPNMSDLRKKDFDAAGELKSPRQEKFDKSIIEADVVAPDDEVVLMDRNDFSRLSYFARKELDRHKDDLETREVLGRKSETPERQPIGVVNRLILAVAVLVMLYAVFCLLALPVGEYQQGKLAAASPADYLFRPSTAMHKQGELSRVDGAGGRGGVISFYFLQPALKRLELDHVIGADRRRFSLDSYSGNELRIDNGPWADTLEVTRFYSQHWPTNRSALMSVPYLTMSRNGQAVLLAFERRSSGLLPGLQVFDVVSADGGSVGLAYEADNLLHIKLAKTLAQGSVAEAEITLQLMFLFSLLEL